jgi:hypothetical protein
MDVGDAIGGDRGFGGGPNFCPRMLPIGKFFTVMP